jgi:hypothetical protein
MNWNIFAPGTSYCGREGIHSHSAVTDCGQYHIVPQGVRGLHLGYYVQFADTQGLTGRGLWHDLNEELVNLREAKKLCQAHYADLQAQAAVTTL